MKTTQLSLTEDEVSTLRKTLEFYLSDLRMEIVDTEDKDFREGLKKEKELLKKILVMLNQ
jgi:hypothetical protein